MPEFEERRAESRAPADSSAYLFWEAEGVYCEMKARAVEVGERGMTLRGRTGLRPGAILYCAVPAHGIYTRARVANTRGFLRRTAGLEFLACALSPELL